MKKKVIKIVWELPECRKGLAGSIDKFIGPGATRAEKNLQFYIPLGAAFILVLISYIKSWGWSVTQTAIAALITVDMVGGIITNATSSAKRWYFRDGQGFKEHISFISLHFFQLVLISYFFLDFDLLWIVFTGSYMLFACAVVLKTQLYLQRPVSFLLYSISITLSLYIFKIPEHLEWFLPFFYLKLLISHCLREEPYRPTLDD